MIRKLMFLNIYTLKETIMELAILIVGVGAVAVWYFMPRGGRKE